MIQFLSASCAVYCESFGANCERPDSRGICAGSFGYGILMPSQKADAKSETAPTHPAIGRAHEYLAPIKEAYGYCKRCARRSTPCVKCGFCYLCHPFKEYEEEAEIFYQNKKGPTNPINK